MAKRETYSDNPDLNSEIDYLVRHRGWIVDKNSGRHVKVRSKGGALIVLPRTASDHRGSRNDLARIRRIKIAEGIG
jgi:hypothetical protein